MPDEAEECDHPTRRDLPFPSSLCHSCGAPPRYVRNGRSTFILCPLLPDKYPPQPVRRCREYRPRTPTSATAEPEDRI